jgi:amino acid transporter
VGLWFYLLQFSTEVLDFGDIELSVVGNQRVVVIHRRAKGFFHCMTALKIIEKKFKQEHKHLFFFCSCSFVALNTLIFFVVLLLTSACIGGEQALLNG